MGIEDSHAVWHIDVKDRMMTINRKQNLVIIKGKDHTDDILRVVQEGERTAVTYKSGKSYRYAQYNVEWFVNPDRIPVENCRVFIAGDLLSDVEEVFAFQKVGENFPRKWTLQVLPFFRVFHAAN